MSELFDLLREKGITDGPSACEKIEKLKPMKVLDLLGECFMATNKTDNSDTSGSIFRFTANSQLAGGIYPCSNVACRLEAAYRLALFGTLYSDAILLPNFFDYFYEIIQSEDDPFRDDHSIHHLYNRFIGDIAVYFEFRPLIDSGLAKINQTIMTVCKHCHRLQKQREKGFQKEIEAIVKTLENRILKEVEFKALDGSYIGILDKSNYIGGDTGLELPRKNTRFAPYMKKAPYRFKPQEIKQLGLIDRVVGPAVNDLLEHNYYKQRNATYLTDRQLDLDIIEKATKIEKLSSPANPLGLYHHLPYLDDVLLEDLVKLRKTVGAAFKVYRDALTLLIKEHGKNAKEIVDEVINPATNSIDNVIHNNMRHYRERAGKKMKVDSALATVGFVASSLFNISALPITAKAMFSGSQIIDDWINNGQIPQTARNNQFYFLWKAKRVLLH